MINNQVPADKWNNPPSPQTKHLSSFVSLTHIGTITISLHFAPVSKNLKDQYVRPQCSKMSTAVHIVSWSYKWYIKRTQKFNSGTVKKESWHFREPIFFHIYITYLSYKGRPKSESSLDHRIANTSDQMSTVAFRNINDGIKITVQSDKKQDNMRHVR